MRLHYMLLAFAASVTAESTARPRRSDESGLTLKSRKHVDSSQLVEARFASADDVFVPGGPLQCNPTSDEYNVKDCRNYIKHQQEEVEEANDRQKKDGDDDDDDKEKGHSKGFKVGVTMGCLFGLLFLLTIWYFIRIRPRRRARILEQRRKMDELGSGYEFSAPGTHLPTRAAQSMPGSQNPSHQNVRFQPTPYPGNVPSPSVTDSSISGLALPTPALTYSPTGTSTTTASPLSPLPLPTAHASSDGPPAYTAVAALQSSEPQHEASAYQMGQTPMPMDPPRYDVTETPRTALMDMKGQPVARY
ncbi:uncharacterized protein F4812DRAFT_342377 [Daldinia caldariorum]|uniref:uncharacterized protein n=1 Tax=Daldinia caldariorum TaxID=326644 RepID=UPI002008470D|nr:uncharacterized protein F4812DRAFT_342377 [Daldinia caldariorum]KAI1468722.1 hypothetical protein F4812DRAFT_342377 [Daldinia caldariorum]